MSHESLVILKKCYTIRCSCKLSQQNIVNDYVYKPKIYVYGPDMEVR